MKYQICRMAAILVAFAVILIPATAKAQASLTSFSDEEFSVAFEYPAGWDIQVDDLDEEELNEITIYSEDRLQFITISLHQEAGIASAQQWFDDHRADYHPDLVTEQARFQLKGNDTLLIGQPDTCVTAGMLTAIIARPDEVYTIAYYEIESRGSTVEFFQLLNTLAFDTSSPSPDDNDVPDIGFPEAPDQFNCEDVSAASTTSAQICSGASMYIPTAGDLGVPWGCFHQTSQSPCPSYHSGASSSYLRSPHRGLDFFGDRTPGVTPVYATYNGVARREGSHAVKIAFDGVHAGKSVYMAHMANNITGADYRTVVNGQRVTGGVTQIGRQGNKGVQTTHLHISYLNNANGYETDFSQTLNPTQFLNANHLAFATGWNHAGPIACMSAGGDPFEADNSLRAAKTIETNGTAQRHSIHTPGDQDWMKFTAVSGTRYTIETFDLAGSADTYMGLFWDNHNDGHEDLISYDDDGGTGYASRIVWTASRNGTFWVKVRDYHASRGYADRQYSIRITQQGGSTNTGGDRFEADNSLRTAKTIETNGSAQRHSIHTPGDQDWMKFTAVSGTRYTIETFDLAGSADTYMGLFWDNHNDGHEDLIAYDDDGGTGYASRIVWTASRNGTFWVKVRDYHASRGSADRQYSIRITQQGGSTDTGGDRFEADNSLRTAKTIETNGTAQRHSIHTPGDQDWMKFTAVSGTRYTIETFDLAGGADTYMGLFWDNHNDGHEDLISYDDDGGTGYASRIVWTASRNGTFWVKVRDYHASRGSADRQYSIRITQQGGSTNTGGDRFEADNSLRTAKTIETTGSAQRHSIHTPGDQDWMKFTAVSGTRYTIETFDLAGGADTYMGLFWDNQNDGHEDLIAYDDDGGSTRLASRIVWRAPSNGTFWVKVRDYYASRGSANRQYSVRITSTRTVTSANADEDDSLAASAADDVAQKAAANVVEGTISLYTGELLDEDYVTIYLDGARISKVKSFNQYELGIGIPPHMEPGAHKIEVVSADGTLILSEEVLISGADAQAPIEPEDDASIRHSIFLPYVVAGNK